MKQGIMQLLDIMNEVSARLDHAPVFAKPACQQEPMDEMQAFMLLDPLLADLHKQYIDARAMRIQAHKEFGAGDGMCDMAVMMEDSAWCAMQTRYMELRGNRDLMAKAHGLMDEDRREEEEREKAAKTREALKLIDQMQMLLRVAEMQKTRATQDKARASWFLFLMLMLDEKGMMFREHHASYSFNRLAA